MTSKKTFQTYHLSDTVIRMVEEAAERAGQTPSTYAEWALKSHAEFSLRDPDSSAEGLRELL